MALVLIYLAAIVLANLSVAKFGPNAAIINAFLFIGLDLTSRDGLHEAWGKDGLWWKMAILISAGGLMSWAMSRDAGLIAVASTTAFAAAAVVDTAVYHIFRKRSKMEKSNLSNVAAATVDSILFPTIAFGGLLPVIVLGQFLAKVAGGYLWSLIIFRRWRK